LFDKTFTGKLFTFDLRGTLFLIYFVSFTLLIWEIGDIIRRKTVKFFSNEPDIIKQFTYLTIVLSCYGWIVAFLFSLTYYLFDFIIFGFHHYDGVKYRFIDLDAFVGIFFGYLFILVMNGQLYLFNQWKKEYYLATQLQKENLQARLEALKNQIDPHFLFNSLSTLTTLVYKNQDMAVDYINQLSRLYRYILEKKDDMLVLLKDELENLESYFFLLRTRFSNFILLDIKIDDYTKDNTYVFPCSLQMLAENAVKHNRCSESEPLKVFIYETIDSIVVENVIRPRRRVEDTSGLGLKNIMKRYELINAQKMEINAENEVFRVSLPKLNQEVYESFNF
jgi:sensor histidine kinase YesM